MDKKRYLVLVLGASNNVVYFKKIIEANTIEQAGEMASFVNTGVGKKYIMEVHELAPEEVVNAE